MFRNHALDGAGHGDGYGFGHGCGAGIFDGLVSGGCGYYTLCYWHDVGGLTVGGFGYGGGLRWA
jgi:hypothetical protein